MEVRIGVVHTPKELTFETDADRRRSISTLEDAIAKGASLVWLEDGKGRKVGVPGRQGRVRRARSSTTASRKVGFGR